MLQTRLGRELKPPTTSSSHKSLHFWSEELEKLSKCLHLESDRSKSVFTRVNLAALQQKIG